MRVRRLLLLLLFNLVFHVTVFATSYSYFDWREMLDSSKVVLLVKTLKAEAYYSKVKVLKTYRGTILPNEEIWISTNSDTDIFGHTKNPIQDEFLVFIDRSAWEESRINYWQQLIGDTSSDTEFFQALKTGRAYFLPRPFAGYLPVKDNLIQYNLFETTFTDSLYNLSLSDFEQFLNAYYNKQHSVECCNYVLAKLNSPLEKIAIAQYFHLLHLLDFKKYDTSLNRFSTYDDQYVKFAYCLWIGGIEIEATTKQLLILLKDKSTLVQAEAVRQLELRFTDEIGAAIQNEMSQLNSKVQIIESQSSYLAYVLSHSKLQMIQTLGKMKYFPSVPVLTKLLVTDDSKEFASLLESLRHMKARTYAKAICTKLARPNEQLLDLLCSIIRQDSLFDCVPSLMNYVKNQRSHVKGTNRYSNVALRSLAHFKTDTVKQFLYTEFLYVLSIPDTSKNSYSQKASCIGEFIQCFTTLKLHQPKTALYNCLYDYYGLNNTFRYNPSLFDQKFRVEDSLVSLVEHTLKPLAPALKVEALVFLDDDKKMKNYTVKYHLPRSENFEEIGILDTLNQKLLQHTAIDKQHLIYGMGNQLKSEGGSSLNSFSSNLMHHFLTYISELAEKEDIVFIENLKKYTYAKSDAEREFLNKFLATAKRKI